MSSLKVRKGRLKARAAASSVSHSHLLKRLFLFFSGNSKAGCVHFFIMYVLFEILRVGVGV